jgi:hypothetical protein
MMKFLLYLSALFLLFFSGCSAPELPPVAVAKIQNSIDYLHDVKPILDKRCVTCHSCYNSPCQAKLSSYDGVDRGASKMMVYDALRISAVAPTRLFIDARTTKEWRDKNFFSLTQSSESNATHNDSIMMHLLYDKKQNPQIIGDYAPEEDELSCPRNKEELEEYVDEKPNHGMPYGFPQINKSEYATLTQWLAQGAKGPTSGEEESLKTPSKNAEIEIQKWEAFLNKDDAKHTMTARYLYEHLYLAHIYFPSAKGEFYELIRSYTPTGKKPEIIPSLRPFDDPQVDKFYYRLQKIHSTIVHKTHMVFKFEDSVLKRFTELFIEPKWMSPPHKMPYDIEVSANPFVVFAQIPPKSRYQFLLDNSRYIVMTFIRGPVCRGQMALNVIHDHFWLMFKDPQHDITVMYPELLTIEADNLSMPIETVSQSLMKAFSDEYKKKYEEYYKTKRYYSSNLYPQGVGLNSIWKGERAEDAPLLTVYRHFDSASVNKGALGAEPRTMWVIDYAQLERIYYTLVAGYDVFGNLSHQTNIRRYMDFLRIEGELNFLEYMPQEKRVEMLKSWYIGDSSVDNAKYFNIEKIPTQIKYKTDNPKNEFAEMVVKKHLLKSTGIAFDTINYKKPGSPIPQMPKQFNSKEDFVEAARSITLPGTGFITSMTDSGANDIFLRVDMDDGSYIVKNLIINRWHNNVNSLFNGDEVLDPKKDTMDILDERIGSYPNVFVIVKQKDLGRFLYLMKYMRGAHEEFVELQKFFVSRSDKNFWEVYDWFQGDFNKSEPIEAGLYDLNRYARTPWEVK